MVHSTDSLSQAVSKMPAYLKGWQEFVEDAWYRGDMHNNQNSTISHIFLLVEEPQREGYVCFALGDNTALYLSH